MTAEMIWTAGVLGAGAWLDWRSRHIPAVLPLILLASGILAQLGKGGFPACLFGLLPGLLLLFLSVAGRMPLGLGDGLMLLGLGIWEGPVSVVLELLAALFLAACWGLAGVLVRGKGLKTEYPFLPFLFLCYLGRIFL